MNTTSDKSLDGALILQGNSNHLFLLYPNNKDLIISKGRFSIVYPAIMMPDRKRVICKFLHNSLKSDPERISRFFIESSLNFEKPGVVKNIDFISHETGLYLFQEYVDGIDLVSYLNGTRISRQNREKTVCRIMVSLLDALVSAHEAGVFHCGLKPGSIIITNDTNDSDAFVQITLIDFALCQTTRYIPQQTTKTRISYNIKYSAPELLLNHLHLVRASTDLFSIGLMMYELISGTPPHKSQNPINMVQMQVSAPIPSHDAISEPVMNIIRKACEKPYFRKPPGAYSFEETDQLLQESFQYRYLNCAQMATDLLKLL
ncbi:MAG: protein kinase [Bacteroidales bacterium]|nr:protein kinase [Bacteroidales bacterium]HQP04847.1 protein kinase [Bacteroidales bacterium]